LTAIFIERDSFVGTESVEQIGQDDRSFSGLALLDPKGCSNYPPRKSDFLTVPLAFSCVSERK
jgi:hypothetical protein